MQNAISGSLATLSINGKDVCEVNAFEIDTDPRTLIEFINSKPGEDCHDVIDRAVSLLSGYDLQSIAISPDGGNTWKVQYRLVKRLP